MIGMTAMFVQTHTKASLTLYQHLDISPLHQIHQDIVQEKVITFESQVDPGSNAIDLCPKRHLQNLLYTVFPLLEERKKYTQIYCTVHMQSGPYPWELLKVYYTKNI